MLLTPFRYWIKYLIQYIFHGFIRFPQNYFIKAHLFVFIDLVLIRKDLGFNFHKFNLFGCYRFRNFNFIRQNLILNLLFLTRVLKYFDLRFRFLTNVINYFGLGFRFKDLFHLLSFIFLHKFFLRFLLINLLFLIVLEYRSCCHFWGFLDFLNILKVIITPFRWINLINFRLILVNL